MDLLWTEYAWEDYSYWAETNIKILKRINDLIKDIKRTPYKGIGKPEPLKLTLSGKWSRRINEEHRLVYAIQGKKEKTKDNRTVTIYQCRYHY